MCMRSLMFRYRSRFRSIDYFHVGPQAVNKLVQQDLVVAEPTLIHDSAQAAVSDDAMATSAAHAAEPLAVHQIDLLPGTSTQQALPSSPGVLAVIIPTEAHQPGEGFTTAAPPITLHEEQHRPGGAALKSPDGARRTGSRIPPAPDTPPAASPTAAAAASPRGGASPWTPPPLMLGGCSPRGSRMPAAGGGRGSISAGTTPTSVAGTGFRDVGGSRSAVASLRSAPRLVLMSPRTLAGKSGGSTRTPEWAPREDSGRGVEGEGGTPKSEYLGGPRRQARRQGAGTPDAQQVSGSSGNRKLQQSVGGVAFASGFSQLHGSQGRGPQYAMSRSAAFALSSMDRSLRSNHSGQSFQGIDFRPKWRI